MVYSAFSSTFSAWPDSPRIQRFEGLQDLSSLFVFSFLRLVRDVDTIYAFILARCELGILTVSSPSSYRPGIYVYTQFRPPARIVQLFYTWWFLNISCNPNSLGPELLRTITSLWIEEIL